MDTAFPITLHLAVAIGVYMTAAGVGGLVAPERWRGLVDEFERSPATGYLIGIAAFAIGATLVIVHNLWGDPLAVVVTLIGWAAAVEGVLMLAFPGPLVALGRAALGALRPFAAVAVILGFALILAGLTGRAVPTILV